VPFKDIEKRRQKCRNYHNKHKERLNIRRHEHYINNRAAVLERMYKYHQTPEGKMNTRKQQVAQYGITIEEYNRLFKLQNGKCAICNVTQEKSLDVDHCHKSNKVRGLLCRKCNLGIGFMQDSPDICKKASEYLR
jgi:hypothetical protein